MKMDDKRNNESTIIVNLHVHLHGSKSFLLRKPEKNVRSQRFQIISSIRNSFLSQHDNSAVLIEIVISYHKTHQDIVTLKSEFK